MKNIVIVTQNDTLFLPEAISIVCKGLSDKISAILVAPPLSTHGSLFKGIKKHLLLFGVKDFVRLGCRIIYSKLRSKFCFSHKSRKYYSIKQVAKDYNIQYYNIPNLQSENFLNVIDKTNATLLISMSCPQIIKKNVRDKFTLGCINVHGAPLPRYRGLMPAFWQLKNNEDQAASTVHVLSEKLDDGDIILQRTTKIDENETWESLVRKTKVLGANTLVEAVNLILSGNVTKRPNLESDATYFSFPSHNDAIEFRNSGKKFFG